MARLNVVICWHMHQPHYRDGLEGAYRLPWVYLHALKDYTDMAAHLEAVPGARCVVNWSPVLLVQLADYVRLIDRHLERGTDLEDELLNRLAGLTPVPDDAAGRRSWIEDCLKAHAPRMIDPSPRHAALAATARAALDPTAPSTTLEYLAPGFFVDLLVWYHLAWTGVSLRRSDPRLGALIAKGGDFDVDDRRLVLETVRAACAGVAPRFRALADAGRVELSMTPYGHPIVPLLLDFRVLAEATPEAPAPMHPGYPGGRDRARWHLDRGLEVFADAFGRRPDGVWLSEGGVSGESVALLGEYGFRWNATGEGVWRHSRPAEPREALFSPHRLPDTGCVTFFRDDGLSDLIGFDYSEWHADDAVADLIGHLDSIRSAAGEQAGERVVSIILDGENAWEYYPDNGSWFVPALYERLAEHPGLELTTFHDVLDAGVRVEPLERLVAGSWVHGTFSTWMGVPDKNHGWDRLVEAKQAYDARIGARPEADRPELEHQLALCEGSDWFWWFGDDNPGESVRDFDRMYRRHLKRLHALLGVPAPANLETPLSLGGSGVEHAGAMRRG
jgi:alpha-amylase/alpha-mannosidase (GH57 family)